MNWKFWSGFCAKGENFVKSCFFFPFLMLAKFYFRNCGWGEGKCWAFWNNISIKSHKRTSLLTFNNPDLWPGDRRHGVVHQSKNITYSSWYFTLFIFLMKGPLQPQKLHTIKRFSCSQALRWYTEGGDH